MTYGRNPKNAKSSHGGCRRRARPRRAGSDCCHGGPAGAGRQAVPAGAAGQPPARSQGRFLLGPTTRGGSHGLPWLPPLPLLAGEDRRACRRPSRRRVIIAPRRSGWCCARPVLCRGGRRRWVLRRQPAVAAARARGREGDGARLTVRRWPLRPASDCGCRPPLPLASHSWRTMLPQRRLSFGRLGNHVDVPEVGRQCPRERPATPVLTCHGIGDLLETVARQDLWHNLSCLLSPPFREQAVGDAPLGGR